MAHNNVREDGFFSVQVISKALQQQGFQCIPIGSETVRDAMRNPTKEQAFVCNRSEHWFVVRRFCEFWFELNSMQESPSHLSDTYLSEYIHQCQREGYSLFVVRGRFETAQIERSRQQLLAAVNACREGGGQVVSSASAAPSVQAFSGAGRSLNEGAKVATGHSDAALAALEAAGIDPNQDPELAAAITASLNEASVADETPKPAMSREEEMRQKRLARFG